MWTPNAAAQLALRLWLGRVAPQAYKPPTRTPTPRRRDDEHGKATPGQPNYVCLWFRKGDNHDRTYRTTAAALDATKEPPRLVDPRPHKSYILLSAEAYERVRNYLEENIDMRQVSILVDRAMREDDEHDPTLAFYQERYGRKP